MRARLLMRTAGLAGALLVAAVVTPILWGGVALSQEVHDARMERIDVPLSVNLSPGDVVIARSTFLVVNEGTHADTIGVYVDVVSPFAGGCVPNGRVLQTNVTLNAGQKKKLSVTVSYSCADPAAADGFRYTWVAVADHAADDLASCGPSTLLSLACGNALADDDNDSADNRLSRSAPTVRFQ